MEMTKETMLEIQRINEQTGFADRLKSLLDASMENTIKFEVEEKTSKIGEPMALINAIKRANGDFPSVCT